MRALGVAAVIATAIAASGTAVIGATTGAFENDRAGAGVRFDVTKGSKSGVGSGVYIGDGIIITAAHVLDGAESFVIKSDAGDEQAGEILWVNKEYDIAAVRPSNRDRFAEAELECREPVVGESITAWGNPGGVASITMRGYVSGESRATGRWRSVFVTDMTTISGMSGGPTYSSYGTVVGVTVGTMGFNAPSGGLGFVVPSSVVCGLLGRE